MAVDGNGAPEQSENMKAEGPVVAALSAKMDLLLSEMASLKAIVADLATAVAATSSPASTSAARSSVPQRQRSAQLSSTKTRAVDGPAVGAATASAGLARPASGRPTSLRTDAKASIGGTSGVRNSQTTVPRLSPRALPGGTKPVGSPNRSASAKEPPSSTAAASAAAAAATATTAPASHAAAAAPAAAAASPAAPADKPATAGEITEASLIALEDKIRDAVRAKGTVHEASKDMLARLFKCVDDGDDDVSLDEFIQVCSQIGTTMSAAEAKAIFKRFGYEATMPYHKLATTLLTQPSRAMAEELPTRKGVFKAGQSAAFNGKILYDHCRKAVPTPSNWDPALAERSAQLPDAKLNLEYVYGCQGAATSQNCFYTCAGQVVYFVAAVGVVQSRTSVPTQTHFLGHNDDIKSLALCRAAVEIKGKQYPANSLVATGQISSVQNGPYVCVWDTRLVSGDPDQEVVRLQFDKDTRGITALGFSPDGTRLVCVSTDNHHMVHLYDWRAQKCLGSWRGYQGDPPQVYGVEWNPFELSHNAASAFLTFGKKHIKVWSPHNNEWAAKSLSVSKLTIQNVTSAAWLPPRDGSADCLVVAGMADGQLYLFKNGTAIKAVPAHQPGPNIMQPDGQPALHGVRGMRLIKDNTVLLTGGSEGVIIQWDVADGSVVEGRHAGPPISLISGYGPNEKPPRVRSLDYLPEGEGRIAVATNMFDVLEVSGGSQTVLVCGQVGDVYGVAFHPVKTEVMATVTDASRLYLFDTQQRSLLRTANLGCKLRSVAISPAPLTPEGAHHIAVGGDKGLIQVLNESTLQQLYKMQDAKDMVTDLKYSPSNKYLAASTADLCIDVYNVEKGYGRVSRCTGHSAVVAGIDWTTDSSILQSHSNDKDLLYWNAKTGKQVAITPRDLELATWTSKCGFPVMGIWPGDGAGHDDINAVMRSNAGRHVVTTDDRGLVKLFNFPCVVEAAPAHVYRGHSSHVMGVRFNRDDTRVVTVGGHDWAVFQFHFVATGGEAFVPPAGPKAEVPPPGAHVVAEPDGAAGGQGEAVPPAETPASSVPSAEDVPVEE